jgi:hypothetical protein
MEPTAPELAKPVAMKPVPKVVAPTPAHPSLYRPPRPPAVVAAGLGRPKGWQPCPSRPSAGGGRFLSLPPLSFLLPCLLKLWNVPSKPGGSNLRWPHRVAGVPGAGGALRPGGPDRGDERAGRRDAAHLPGAGRPSRGPGSPGRLSAGRSAGVGQPGSGPTGLLLSQPCPAGSGVEVRGDGWLIAPDFCSMAPEET